MISIDAGCGTGGHAIQLVKRNYNVVGFDLSKMIIEKARKNQRT